MPAVNGQPSASRNWSKIAPAVMARLWLIASVLCLCAAVCAEASFPLRVPDEAFLPNLGPFSCRADLLSDDPLKNTPCNREELLEYGRDQQTFYVALTVLTEVHPGDLEAAKLVLITIFTRRALVSEPGAEVTLTAIVNQRKQYTGWTSGRLSPAVIDKYLESTKQLVAGFVRGDFDNEPLRFTHYARCDSDVSWLRAARKAGIKILEYHDHCYITGTEEEPALILWPRPDGARKGVSWRRVRDNAPLMFAAIHGQQGKAAGLAMK